MAYTAIDDSEAYFQTFLYTGSGSGRDLTFGGDTDMQPDILWFKRRNGASNHFYMILVEVLRMNIILILLMMIQLKQLE